jgi:kumamolisin
MKAPVYRVPLAGSERSPVPGFHAVRRANPSAIVEATVVLRSRPDDPGPAALDEMANQLPKDRHYLSREQYAAAHSADPADIRKVTQFASAHGLNVFGIDEPARTLHLRGTVAGMQNAFGVALRLYRGSGEAASKTYRGRIGPVYLPIELDGIVTAVIGLDNRQQARAFLRRHRYFGGAWACPLISYTPEDLARHYNFPARVSGSGQCIAIIALQPDGHSSEDLRIYFKRFGITPPLVTLQQVRGGAISAGRAPRGELVAGIQVAGSVAPGVHIVVYVAPPTTAGFLHAVARAVHDRVNRPSVISISWGAAEAAWTRQSMHTLDELFRAACVMGITVCCATGDRGSSDGIPGRMAHASFPASSPHVLACGGTMLGPSGDEAVWNDGPGGGAGGGGISDIFPQPDWQQSAHVPPSANPRKHTGRGLPDVSANACPMTGYQVLIDRNDAVVGGTSVVSPLWAALIALLNQKQSVSTGFFNPLLYGHLTSMSGALRDVTTGHNDLTGLVGAYQAGPGWDACTGWGSPDGSRIMSALD